MDNGIDYFERFIDFDNRNGIGLLSYGGILVAFFCGYVRLLDILVKSEPANNLGVWIALGGLQYRMGGHVHVVLLDRALAVGYCIFYIDYHGMDLGRETS